jgi:hypothetical protein
MGGKDSTQVPSIPQTAERIGTQGGKAVSTHTNAQHRAPDIGQPVPFYDLATGTVQFRHRDADAPHVSEIIRELLDGLRSEPITVTSRQEAPR